MLVSDLLGADKGDVPFSGGCQRGFDAKAKHEGDQKQRHGLDGEEGDRKEEQRAADPGGIEIEFKLFHFVPSEGEFATAGVND